MTTPIHNTHQSGITWKTPHGSIRVLPERGRVLGIEVGGQESLWTPAESSAPWNLGGERLWIGPEADWHWLRLGEPDFAFYKVQPALDPDIWSVGQLREGFFSASVEIDVRSPHRDAHLKVRLTRSIESLPPESLAEVGPSIAFLTTTGLEILGGTHGQPVDLWSILQVPAGGEVVVPVSQGAAPRDYFKPCPRSELTSRDGNFHVKLAGRSQFKLGFQPGRIRGPISYGRPVPGGILSLQRSFPVHPAATYCDSPMSDLSSQGDAVQIYCDDGSFGGFGEIEHRSPAIRCGVGPQILSETTITTLSITPTR